MLKSLMQAVIILSLPSIERQLLVQNKLHPAIIRKRWCGWSCSGHNTVADVHVLTTSVRERKIALCLGLSCELLIES